MASEPQHRVVRGEFRGEGTPLTTEFSAHEDFATSIAASLIKIVSSYWLEMSLIAAVLGIWALLDMWSIIGAFVVTPLLVAALIACRPIRKRLAKLLRHAELKRQFDTAARFAGLATFNDHVPKPVSILDIPAGSRLRVRIPPGSAFSYVEEAAERMATCLDAREVRVEADKTSTRFAMVTVIKTDPFDDSALVWPNAETALLSTWDPIPVGLDEYGEIVTVALPERNVLIGGEPGAGKSVALSQLVATAALDPTCRLTLLDGKRVELACWARCAEHVVGPSLDDAIDVLKLLRVEMEIRYEALLAAARRKVSPDMGVPLHVVVCDELAFYLTMGERKQTTEFATLMRDLVARGRAAGVIVLAATQKPSHDIIPTSLRDLFAFRWALRCTTPQASDTILGQGWATEGFSAKEIDAGQRGVGYLLSEGGQPVRIKSFHLSDEQLTEMSIRAAALREIERNLKVA